MKLYIQFIKKNRIKTIKHKFYKSNRFFCSLASLRFITERFFRAPGLRTKYFKRFSFKMNSTLLSIDTKVVQKKTLWCKYQIFYCTNIQAKINLQSK